MKKAEHRKSTKIEDMKPEYDFSTMKGAVRGKYYQSYGKGDKVIIHKENGIDSVQYFKLEEGAIMLEPDIRRYFSTSEAVNKVLRSLIEIIPAKRNVSTHRK